MKMKTDPDLWAQWTEIMTEDGKKVRCNYCGNKQRRHAAKCRRHTLVCKQAPKEVKLLVGQRYADAQEYIETDNENTTLDQTSGVSISNFLHPLILLPGHENCAGGACANLPRSKSP